MLSGRFLLAVILIAIADSFIQWLFVGFLFHKYQAATPTVWRKETSRSYAASTALYLLFALVFTTVIWLWLHRYGRINLLDGIEFGGLCWLAFVIPPQIESAIYVNFSPMFVVGKCLGGLAECTIAAILAVSIL